MRLSFYWQPHFFLSSCYNRKPCCRRNCQLHQYSSVGFHRGKLWYHRRRELLLQMQLLIRWWLQMLRILSLTYSNNLKCEITLCLVVSVQRHKFKVDMVDKILIESLIVICIAFFGYTAGVVAAFTAIAGAWLIVCIGSSCSERKKECHHDSKENAFHITKS